MKRLKQMFFCSNKGMTLIELLCALVILGVVITVIGGAMVVSAKNYQKSTEEFDVQQEAQITTNLIANLLLDAVEVEYDGINKILKIVGNNVTYLISYDDLMQTLTYAESDGTNTITGELATNISYFFVDDSTFDENKNVRVDLGVKIGEREYKETYYTTSRNDAVSNTVSAVEYANIVLEREIVVEPGQTYKIPVKVLGMSAANAGNLSWDFTGVAAGQLDSYSGNNDYATIKLADSASGSFVFSVKTNRLKSDSSGPLDTETVTVRVRRVDNVQFRDASTILRSGNPCKAGAVYEVHADVRGTYLYRGIGKSYDDTPYAFVDPRYVDFSYKMKDAAGNALNESSYIEVVENMEDIGEPYLKFKLKADMPADSKIIITAVAKHPEGEWDGVKYNKASVQNGCDDPYAPSVVAEFEIEKTGADLVEFPNGILRGTDCMFTALLSTQTIEDTYCKNRTTNQKTNESCADWFIRYRVINKDGSYGDWTPYFKAVDAGNAQKLNASETKLWHPDKAYQLEMAMVGYYINGDGTIGLRWPYDESLLADGLGFKEAGFVKDWDNSVTPTAKSEYCQTFNLDDVTLVFKANDALGTPGGVINIGTRTAPIGLDSGESFTLDFDTPNLHKGTYQSSFALKVHENDGAGGWPSYTPTSANDWTWQYGSTFTIKDVVSTARGRYEFRVVMENATFYNMTDTAASGKVLNPSPFVQEAQTYWELHYIHPTTYTKNEGILNFIVNGG